MLCNVGGLTGSFISSTSFDTRACPLKSLATVFDVSSFIKDLYESSLRLAWIQVMNGLEGFPGC